MNSENEIPVTLSELMELLEDIGNYQRDEGNSAKGESNSGSATSIPNETTNSVGVASKIHEHTSPRPPRKRIRKVGSVPYSTVLQRRRRAELLSLRSEAQELERRLAQLQQSHIEEAKPLARKSQPGRGNWRSVAINARKERYHTECTNRELKEILSNRLNMFASIQKILRQSGGFEVRLTYADFLLVLLKLTGVGCVLRKSRFCPRPKCGLVHPWTRLSQPIPYSHR